MYRWEYGLGDKAYIGCPELITEDKVPARRRNQPPPPPLLRLEESLPRNDPDTDGFRLESANPSNHTFPGARPFQHARDPRCEDVNCYH